jgi:hypothetical protein
MKIVTPNNIGKIRRFLFVPWSSWWNAWVRDVTAKMERS